MIIYERVRGILHMAAKTINPKAETYLAARNCVLDRRVMYQFISVIVCVCVSEASRPSQHLFSNVETFSRFPWMNQY